MTFSIPTEVEDVLHAATASALPAALLMPAALTAAVVDRSRRYTSERDRLATPADARADLAARALFFSVADAAKVALPLAELAAQVAWPPATLRIVDVGAGCGAMSLGVLAALHAAGHAPAIELTLLDDDARALAIGRAALVDLAARWGMPLTLDVRAGDARRAALPPCDLVLAGSVLNELPGPDALALAERLVGVATLATIIIEPALRITARPLHQLRDALLAGGRAVVAAPCTHAAPCPMLADERDWCHEARPAMLPPRAAKLAATTGLRDGDLKFAYLLLRPPGSATGAPERLRVVSAPMPQKGKLELWVCGADGRRKLRVLDRHRTDGAKAMRAAQRGDVVQISPTPDERGDVGADTAVMRDAIVGPFR